MYLPNPGDIGFSYHTGNKISAIMAWFMRSQWSHAWIVYDVGLHDQIYTLETTSFEVTYQDISCHTEGTELVEIYSPLPHFDSERKAILAEANKELGTTYGFLQLPSLGIRALLRRFSVRIKNFIRAGDVCCQVPLAGYSVSTIPGLQGIDPKSIDTEEFYQIVKNSPFFKLVYSKKV